MNKSPTLYNIWSAAIVAAAQHAIAIILKENPKFSGHYLRMEF